MTEKVYILRYLQYKSRDSNFLGVYKTKELVMQLNMQIIMGG